VAKRLILAKEEHTVTERELNYVHSNDLNLCRKVEHRYSEMEAKLK
jgi:hypothetical protein